MANGCTHFCGGFLHLLAQDFELRRVFLVFEELLLATVEKEFLEGHLTATLRVHHEMLTTQTRDYFAIMLNPSGI